MEALNAAQKRLVDFFKGLVTYHTYPLIQERDEKPILWQQGTTRVLDYADQNCDAKKPVILFIPSLINKAYILDLTEERSILKYMAKEGFHPMLADWQEPGKEEYDFGIEDYVERLETAITDIKRKTNKRVVLAGYCMGGLMALALTQIMKNNIDGLILLATPWDFHSKDTERLKLYPEHSEIISQMISATPLMHKHLVQTIFYSLHPFSVHDKFRNFAALDVTSKEAEEFVHIENWLNDGVALTRKVALECLIDWVQHNLSMKNEWQTKNKKIKPSTIKIPTFIAIPQNDKIVPPLCAEPLVQMIKGSTVIRPETGHIGMVVGKKSKKQLWQPLVKWLNRI